MFQLYHGIVFLYVALRLIVPLPWRLGWKALAIAVLLPVSQHHQIYRQVFGTMFSPEIPHPFVVLIGWSYATLVLLFVFSVILDGVGLIVAVMRRRLLTPEVRARLRYGVMGLALVLATFGVWQAIRVPDVRRVDLEVRQLPRELEGVRVVQLTDLHLSRLLEGPWARAVVERTNALQPDLIVITGDLIDGTTEARREDVEPLRDLKAKHGVIVIPGNHEYYFGIAEWSAVFEGFGMRVLVNEHVTLPINQSTLVVAGVTDQVAARYGMAGPDIAAALKGRPAGVPTLLLSHRPAGARSYAEAGADIQLSGHTHGGMIVGFNRLVANANEGFVSGKYQVGAMQLYLSNGTGLWNGFPIRLGVPSEITELTLRRAP